MVVICQVVVSQAFNPSTWDAVRQIDLSSGLAWSGGSSRTGRAIQRNIALGKNINIYSNIYSFILV